MSLKLSQLLPEWLGASVADLGWVCQPEKKSLGRGLVLAVETASKQADDS